MFLFDTLRKPTQELQSRGAEQTPNRANRRGPACAGYVHPRPAPAGFCLSIAQPSDESDIILCGEYCTVAEEGKKNEIPTSRCSKDVHQGHSYMSWKKLVACHEEWCPSGQPATQATRTSYSRQAGHLGGQLPGCRQRPHTPCRIANAGLHIIWLHEPALRVCRAR